MIQLRLGYAGGREVAMVRGGAALIIMLGGLSFALAAGRYGATLSPAPPPGAVLDGGNATARCFVHDPGLIPYSASSPRYSVTLRNLTIRNYAPAKQDCAVNAADTGQGWSRVLEDRGDRNGWLLDHCTFERNRAGGALLGSASTVSP